MGLRSHVSIQCVTYTVWRRAPYSELAKCRCRHTVYVANQCVYRHTIPQLTVHPSWKVPQFRPPPYRTQNDLLINIYYHSTVLNVSLFLNVLLSSVVQADNCMVWVDRYKMVMNILISKRTENR